MWLDEEAKQYLFPGFAEQARKVKHNIMEIKTDAGSRDFLILEVDMPYPSRRLDPERYEAGEKSKNCLILVEIAKRQELLAMSYEDVLSVLNETGGGAGAQINIFPRKSVHAMAKYGDLIPLLDQFDNKTIWDPFSSSKQIHAFQDRLCGRGPFADENPKASLLRCTDSAEIKHPLTNLKVAERKLLMALGGYFDALWLWPDGSQIGELPDQCKPTSVSDLVREASNAQGYEFQQRFIRHLARAGTDAQTEEACVKIDKDDRNVLGHVGLQMHFVEKHAPFYYNGKTSKFTDRIRFVGPPTPHSPSASEAPNLEDSQAKPDRPAKKACAGLSFENGV